jgi:uncharacterized LabA/DUF88 family protein
MSIDKIPHDIAVFWDYQNVGFKKGSSLAKDILEYLKQRGRVVAAYAYSDWKHCSDEAASVLFQNRYELIHIPQPTKNSADVLMTAHVMIHLTTAPNIMEYILVSKDYDFRPLTANLQRMGKRVILVCNPVDTNPNLLEMVDDYISLQDIQTEALFSSPEESVEQDETATADPDLERKSAFVQLQETVREIQRRGNLAGIGYTKIIMTALNPGFDETELGFEKWGDFVVAASNEGYVVLEGEGASIIISLPKKISRTAKDTLDKIQAGFDLLVQVVSEMEREGKTPELVLVASKMHSVNPEFKAANLGFRKFYDFAKAAAQRRLINIELVPGKQPIFRTATE